jgi:6-phosphogluconolactonase (cycloisomerase 2 family)
MSKKGLVVCLFALAVVFVFSTSAQTHGQASAKAVFVMTNNADRNEILSFARAADGSLNAFGSFTTGGRGSGGNNDPLESQGSLRLSEDGSLLFAVNAGSGQLSVFRVFGPALALTQVATVDGSEPVAVAQHGNLVYVLNAGGSSAVVGFSLQHGRLERIANSRTFLSTNTSGPGSLAFSPDGRFLVVSEKSTNLIDVFPVNVDGTLGAIVKTPSADPGLFAVSFAPNGALIAAETGPAGGSNASTVASYAVQADGTLAAITTNLGTLGNANCWNAITPDGRFVYNSNAGSSNIAGFAIGSDGSLTALPGTVVGSNPAGSTNLDITVSADGKFLYTLNSHAGTIGVFAIHSDGTLSNVGEASGLTPLAGFNGIAAN